MADAFEELAGRIGRDTAEALRAEGWQPPTPKPKEPARIVTMEESRERHVRYLRSEPIPWTREQAEKGWLDIREHHDAINAADDRQFKAVNRRLIEGLPHIAGDYGWLDDHGMHRVHIPSALRLFCGEGA